MSNRFKRMCEQSLISEMLVRDFLDLKFPFQFHITPHNEQLAFSSSGIHVADIQCVEKPNVAFEVKEDIMSSKTGNLAFEILGLHRLRLWGLEAGIQHIYLLYINHIDFCLDVFELGMYEAKLELELENLQIKNAKCRLVNGGDQYEPMYIVPLEIARSLNCCRSSEFFTDVDMFLFSKSAKIRLQR